MKIWIDIGHPAQLNFYRNTIKILSANNDLLVTVLNRGKLLKIARKELNSIQNCEIIPLGKHSGSKTSAVIDANFFRLFKLFDFYSKNKPQIAVGNGFLHGIIGKTFGIPVIMFSDDIERKMSKLLMKNFSSKLYYVTGSDSMDDFTDIKIFNSLKEWAYLSPNYFHPSIDSLSKYSIEENNYIFVREVITGTLNYQGQSKNVVASIADKFPSNIKVLLSLEDKSQRDQYPKDWIMLEEPIEDIHSLIYCSRLLISSGDSMAREGSILGVPSIYCGVREMKANNVMIEKGMLFHKNIDDVPGFILEIINNNDIEEKEQFRNRLNKDWIDVTQFIIDEINNYKTEIDDNQSQI